ncbi:hypothetical protein BSLG_008062 [Batrachochytrium salamandrivorans]|nr:hypothetical protein BSLG_008062 [Batrachochytrium salamandrivorans]
MKDPRSLYTKTFRIMAFYSASVVSIPAVQIILNINTTNDSNTCSTIDSNTITAETQSTPPLTATINPDDTIPSVWTITHVSESVTPLLGHAVIDLLGTDLLDLLSLSERTRVKKQAACLSPSIALRECPFSSTLSIATASGAVVCCYSTLQWVTLSTLIIELDIVAHCDALAWPDVASLDTFTSIPPSQQQSSSCPRTPSLDPSNSSSSPLPSSTNVTIYSGSESLTLPHSSTKFFESSFYVVEILHRISAAFDRLTTTDDRIALYVRILIHFSVYGTPVFHKFEDLDLSTIVTKERVANNWPIDGPGISPEEWDSQITNSTNVRVIYDNERTTSAIVSYSGAPSIPTMNCLLRPSALFQTRFFRKSKVLTNYTFRHVDVGSASSDMEAAHSSLQTLLQETCDRQIPMSEMAAGASGASGEPMLTRPFQAEPCQGSFQSSIPQSHSSAGLEYMSPRSIDSVIHATAVERAAGDLVSSINNLLIVVSGAAAVFSVNHDKRIIGPPELNVELTTALAYLEAKSIKSIVVSNSFGRDTVQDTLETQANDSGIACPVFKELSGMLYIPLSASGDAFISFFRRSGPRNSNPFPDFSYNSMISISTKADPWSRNDENLARVLQVLYWWFVTTYQERETAMQNDRLKNMVLANISYEVRAPLNTIINYLELMLEDRAKGDTDFLKLCLQQAHDASHCLAHTINNLLLLTQMDAGKSAMRSETFALKACIQEAVEGARSAAESKGLKLNTYLDPSLGKYTVLSDPRKLRQIISVLCDNAILYTTQGHINVSCKILQMVDALLSFELTVEDTGSGIPNSKLELIRESLKEGKLFRQPSVQGTGIGLAIISRLLRQMNGHISIDTEENKGTLFSVKMSMKVSEEEQPASVEIPVSVPIADTEVQSQTIRSELLNILIVDDNPINQQILQRRLINDGHTAVVASSGKESYDLFRMHSALPASVSKIAKGEVDNMNTSEAKPISDTSSPQSALSALIPTSPDGASIESDQSLDVAADSLKTALAPFDLVLTDIQMPGWSGIKATQHIRAYEKAHGLAHVPIIGVTGTVDSSDRELCRSSGMNGFILKPVDIKTLRRIILDVVRGQRSSVGNGWVGWF